MCAKKKCVDIGNNRIDSVHKYCLEKGIEVRRIQDWHFRLNGKVDYYPRKNRVFLLEHQSWITLKSDYFKHLISILEGDIIPKADSSEVFDTLKMVHEYLLKTDIYSKDIDLFNKVRDVIARAE